ncbi:MULTISPECIES: HAD family phosphatase [unclassified Arcicella]|uniref:HAD family hydrolase n=1 Tax=unclassified Arcicella TaxID=2644986 RepID=UPI00285CCC53|nr:MULTISPECIES: HAD family phosphatase [unclassified Arcicella]MDR6564141.1 HAD superfamily hydrolase (TIGR01509 family) [Arcicella sp. BE51]MDR6813894.1 HAD superfamily hydrolase (TIGR01509 family) [Arcicella sp. BE140]MDR6825206.1 HAD superfamily hydrolase (TIGR01509 family) [Arcicella sp. BE139]
MQAFIFDMDGTMVDNMMVHHRAWQLKLKELGLDLTLEEVKERCHGKNEEIIERLFPHRFTTEERYQVSFEKEEHYRKVFKDELKLIDGLANFLEEAKAANIPMGIGSAAPAENVDFVLDNLGIRHYFSSVVHSGLVDKGKPDPEVFEKVAKELGILLDKSLVFEDSPTGAKTSENAGCTTIILTTTHDEAEFEQFSNIKLFLKDYQNLTIEQVKNLFNTL